MHLHNHTHYSLLDGLTKVPELVDFVKNDGMEAVAVTDHGTMSGLVELYKCCNDAGIKPLLGLEAYVAARKMTDKDPAHDKQRFHITLIAMNNKGYENLCRIMSDSEEQGKYYKPRTDHNELEKYNEGLICLSGCMGSEISEAIRADDDKRALELIKWYSKVFKDRFYLEMQDHGHPKSSTHSKEQQKVNEWHMAHAKELGLPLVVTCDAHYLKHERCNVDLQLGRILIPKFPVPDGEDEKTYLDKLVFQGLVNRYGGKKLDEVSKLSIAECRDILEKVDEERDELHKILPRIDYELSVVDKMGYNGYFLIVQDFINWGKSQRIVYGPGRGSAAGSILAYALRITELDPLKYDLLFERFLNPDRISMPDIDTDIQDTRRDEVIEYCSHKYGYERVSNIVTFGKMMAKNARK